MIDPEQVTNYALDDAGLEENALFWALVAGKTADVIAVALNRLLDSLTRWTGNGGPPFTRVRAFRSLGLLSLRELLKQHGIGCHGARERTLYELVDAGLDLRTCSLADLTGVYGIGLKTASCFILHTRADTDVVGLDTHMLAELRDRGHEAPKTTPSSLKTYEKWSAVVRSLARDAGMTLPAFDLAIFNKRHRKVFRADGTLRDPGAAPAPKRG